MKVAKYSPDVIDENSFFNYKNYKELLSCQIVYLATHFLQLFVSFFFPFFLISNNSIRVSNYVLLNFTVEQLLSCFLNGISARSSMNCFRLWDTILYFIGILLLLPLSSLLLLLSLYYFYMEDCLKKIGRSFRL